MKYEFYFSRILHVNLYTHIINYDAKAYGKPFEVGDRVCLHIPYGKKGKSLKLDRLRTGPFIVVKKLSDLVYRIQMEDNRKKRVVVHFNRLKKCYDPKHRRHKNIVQQELGTVPETSNGEGPEQKEWIVLSHRRNLPSNQRRSETSMENPLTGQIRRGEHEQSTGNTQIPAKTTVDDHRATVRERPRRDRKKPDWFKF